MTNNSINQAVNDEKTREDVNDVLDVFWCLLMEVESKTEPNKDILNKRMVESAYRVWNRVHPDKKIMRPRWIEG